jgi:hypothetical protein
MLYQNFPLICSGLLHLSYLRHLPVAYRNEEVVYLACLCGDMTQFVVCALFNVFSSSDFFVSNDGMINNEWERIWKEALVA